MDTSDKDKILKLENRIKELEEQRETLLKILHEKQNVTVVPYPNYPVVPYLPASWPWEITYSSDTTHFTDLIDGKLI